jgi:hypothetical protein
MHNIYFNYFVHLPLEDLLTFCGIILIFNLFVHLSYQDFHIFGSNGFGYTILCHLHQTV